MSIKEGHICRLCLKVAENEFVIDEIVKQMLGILLLKVDLDITRDPIICQDCMEVAKKCFYFKSTCIHMERVILSHVVDKIEVKRNIKVIYEPFYQISTAFHENFKICRFCMTGSKSNNFVSQDSLRIESMLDILSRFMAEMDFNTIENPLICTNCRENLECYFKFVLNCLESEEKLRAYCKEKGIASMDQVKLFNALQYIFTDIFEYIDKCSQPCKIEQNHSECEYPETYIEFIKQEELEIKDEKMNLIEMSAQEYDEGNNLCMPYSKTRGHNNEGYINQKYVQANITEDGLIDDDLLHVKRSNISNNGQTKTKRSKNVNRCITVNSDAAEAERQHVLKDPIGLCKRTSEPKQNKKVNTHKLIQNNIFDPQSYTLVDGGVPEIKMHKCSFCAYETKRKYSLNAHMIVHKDVSEIKMTKCSLCAFETKRKSSLKKHMLVHKDVSETKMFKCPLCAFESKYKMNLKRHMVFHKPVTEIRIYKCSLCGYEARKRCYVVSHMRKCYALHTSGHISKRRKPRRKLN